jgi:Fic family protein
MFNVRRKAANSYLKKLIDLGFIARKGAGNAVYYVFKVG